MSKQGLQGLYANDNFRLIRVTKDQDPDVPPRMQLVCPADDAAVRHDLESGEKGYYCISHCWGPEEERITWTDSNIVDVNGDPLPVQIRSKKCKTLLRLLETHGGYWWIDLFCANPKHGEPPLEFMDDVYRHCRYCVALLDCPHIAINIVGSHISGTWPDYYDVPFHTKNNEVVKKYVEYASNNNNAATNLDMLIKIMVETVYPGIHEDFAPAVSDILRCSWYSRVWTLQEAMLPRHTVLIAEDFTSFTSVQYRYIATIVEQVQGASVVAENRLAATRVTGAIGPLHPQRSMQSSSMKFFTTHPIIPATDRMREVARSTELLKRVLDDAYYPLLLLALSMTRRQCQYKRDYIFGVLGILGIRTSFTEDLKALWKDFLETLKLLLPKHIELPWDYDLTKAPSLDHVFASFNPKKALGSD